MIYNTGGGQISFQGGGLITLTAATTGPYAGLLIYQNRTLSTQINMANGSTTTLTGTIYAPAANISFAGGASLNQFGSQIIAKTLTASNNAYVGISGDPTTAVSRLGSALVE